MIQPIKEGMPLDIEKVRRLRLQANLSMDRAAALAKLSGRQAWHLIESGRKSDVKLSTLESIARALGVRPSELLADDPEAE
jgi:transcriptional regulator with XRE-family HTH domain